jgi:hypothetical protein
MEIARRSRNKRRQRITRDTKENRIEDEDEDEDENENDGKNRAAAETADLKFYST